VSGLEQDPESRQLCADCVGERFLASKIEKQGRETECSYCGKDRKCFSITQLANILEVFFEQHFDLTDEFPSGYELALMDEFGWDRHGDPVADVIEMHAEIDREPAEDIQSVLADRHYDVELVKMSEEGPFDDDAHYESKDVDDYESRADWNRFKESLKFEGRYFNRAAEAVLSETFEGLEEHTTRDGRPVIISAGPGSNLNNIYRARVFQTSDQLEQALKRPDLEIGPPPAISSASGRMNAPGIAVFYGATVADIALAEVRPPVGSKVLVGCFQILRSLRLLDIEALQAVYAEGSLFDPDYLRRLKRAKFLRWLSTEITQPVLPIEEHFGYLATQAMADYLAAHGDPPLDGIVYPSVQGTEGKTNVVLFQKAARVETLSLPDKTEFSVQLSSTTEDDEEVPTYSVWEEVADRSSDESAVDHLSRIPITVSFNSPDEIDERQLTLRLDVTSLHVYHIEAVKFKTESYSVTRHRIRRSSRTDTSYGKTISEESLDF
jgi:hypothetical protein